MTRCNRKILDNTLFQFVEVLIVTVIKRKIDDKKPDRTPLSNVRSVLGALHLYGRTTMSGTNEVG